MTLHRVRDNKRLYFLISRKKRSERKRAEQGTLFNKKEGERWGNRPRYQRGERVWKAATNPLLFCFGLFFSSIYVSFSPKRTVCVDVSPHWLVRNKAGKKGRNGFCFGEE